LPAPTYLYAGNEIDTSVITISSNSELTIYRDGIMGTVYFTTDGSDPRTWDLNASVSANALSENGITISKATTLKARTKNGNEWSPLHEILVIPEQSEITVAIEPDEAVISGVNMVNKVEKLHIYPNPVTNKLFLARNSEYIVYSLMGKIVKSGTGTEIPMKNLPNGFYIIIIDNKPYKVLKSD
jgi:hypothetical protein